MKTLTIVRSTVVRSLLCDETSTSHSSDHPLPSSPSDQWSETSATSESNYTDIVDKLKFYRIAAVKDEDCWNLTTYHLCREIGFRSKRMENWIEADIALSRRAKRYLKTIPRSLRTYMVTVDGYYHVKTVNDLRRVTRRVQFGWSRCLEEKDFEIKTRDNSDEDEEEG